MPSLTAAAMGSVPPDRGGIASGTVSTARQLGFAIGIAVLATAFNAGATASLASAGVPDPAAVADALSAGRAAPGPAAVPAALHDAALAGLDRVFLLSGALAAAGALAVIVLVRAVRDSATPPATESTTGMRKAHA
ncbi:hypothetical protein [Pseudosporangium ferrugineum]|uniref:MFS transporter n=1 Tax=Pseudosporangium ferrugineum TaxID=439699 RepID=A0A2T0SFE0_9ACTN|nr:hypothetical protein [Pseudosporangium ferrugineum]PRY32136.1 hypothetical protein CLV70_102347 [Pseudosporangium ferrugineum]